MLRAIIFIGLALALTALGLFLKRDKSEAKLPATFQAAQPGSLTPFEACEHRVGKAKFEAQCSTLTVPENWDDPQARLITLPVIRIPASRPDPAEPVFILLGGPGASNLSFAPRDWLLEKHDVVLVGYRGVDGSVDLKCSQISQISAHYLGKSFLSDAANAELVAAAGRCAETFQAAGVDLSGYTAQAVVEDLEAVRKALGYPRIHLWSESYGTRVAQLYAYLHPQSLQRALMIGMNTPGHFVYDPAVLDGLLEHISDLYAQSPQAGRRSADLAQTIRAVNHDMPDHWLFFPIDAGTMRMLSHMMFFANANMPMVLDAYLAAAGGDPSGLAMLNFIAPFVFPFDMFHMGDFLTKGGTLDLEYYRGPDSIRLGDSCMGAPLAEWVWPMAAQWPVEPVDASLRQFQESEVEMLVVNGTIDFSTPPNALDELKPYYHNAQVVLLAEFSHVADVEGLQPAAFQRLVTSYYDSGVADASQFVYQPLSFRPAMSLAQMAKLLLGAIVLLPPLLIGVLVLAVQKRKRKPGKSK